MSHISAFILALEALLTFSFSGNAADSSPKIPATRHPMGVYSVTLPAPKADAAQREIFQNRLNTHFEKVYKIAYGDPLKTFFYTFYRINGHYISVDMVANYDEDNKIPVDDAIEKIYRSRIWGVAQHIWFVSENSLAIKEFERAFVDRSVGEGIAIYLANRHSRQEIGLASPSILFAEDKSIEINQKIAYSLLDAMNSLCIGDALLTCLEDLSEGLNVVKTDKQLKQWFDSETAELLVWMIDRVTEDKPISSILFKGQSNHPLRKLRHRLNRLHSNRSALNRCSNFLSSIKTSFSK